MGLAGRVLLICAGMWALGTTVAAAEPPPASCVQKFVGSWTVRVNATGQTYPLLVRPNGTAHITCPLCPSEGTWTCNGNTFVSINTSTTAALSADGRTMTGSCCTTTRVSAPPAAAASAVAGTPAKTVSCEIIRKPAPAFKDCDDADFALQAARAARDDYPRVAADQYKQAAAAARRAGDSKLELTILRESTTTSSAGPRE
jgi:hypothetical protein